MTGHVAVVTDSTAYLPPGEAAARGIQVVPLQVVIGGVAYSEGAEATPARVAEALRARVPVTTSRPAPQAFTTAYDAAAADGASAVVSVHLSAEMSGTHGSAVLAARDAVLPVRVLDSRSMGMGLGYTVLAAAEAAAAGEGVDEVTAVAEKRAASTRAVFYVDTLEHLRRGGRIGRAAALLGSAIAVKPLLHLVDGHVEPLERQRTFGRAVARLEELACSWAAEGAQVDVTVHHLASPERAAALAGRLRLRLPELRRCDVTEVGAVVGAHVGPGMLAVVVAGS